MHLPIELPHLPPTHRSYEGQRVCVTGGAGFIGSHIVDGLVHRGARVSVIDDFSNGHEANLAAVADRITLHRGSILDAALLDRAVADCELVFHEAALASVPESVEHPLRYAEVNDAGTLALLEAARRAGVRRVVYAASSSAYGDRPESPKQESLAPAPTSPYAVSKLAGEFWLRSHAACYGLETIALRYFNVFGPRQRADSPYSAVIPRFVDALRSGSRPTIFGDGTQTRDFVSVFDVAWANLLAGSVPTPLQGDAVNIGLGTGTSLLELLGMLGELLGLPSEATFAPARAGDVMHSTASIELARTLIGFEPVVGFRKGLELLVAESR